MSLVFSLRRAFDRGEPVGAAKTHLRVRGTLTVLEQRDDFFRRVVKTAVFRAVDADAEAVPPLRNVDILQWTGERFVLTGVEELAEDKLARPRLYAQTWQMVPEPLEELMRKDQQVARLAFTLSRLGVNIQLFPDGGMRIPGEVRADGQPVEGLWG